MKNLWKNGIWGVVVGDALGCPVQFESREQVAADPVNGMIGWRTFNMAPGTWTDDTSLTLATLESIGRLGTVDLYDIADNFVKWLENGKFTPYGFSFDIGRGTMDSIRRYEVINDVLTCGGTSESNNGNGSLMRIMPAVLYCIENNLVDSASTAIIHHVSAITHAHERAMIACGLYYFMAKEIVRGSGSLIERLQAGLEEGFLYYIPYPEISHYDRLNDLSKFKETDVDDIESTGYVVDSLLSPTWCLITTDSLEEALLKAVNLGGDTDSIAAIAGGLAGLYYGYDAIPKDWLDVIQRKEYIDTLLEPVK